ncbi:hypothetical protein SADUNF_Sadunf17G0072400 [Salix dunnii]|uniref:Protein kinase domain-containing protein n=1 Tax=Salix dunnii TaxID=1413687 RepID=A0A835JA92_9ROSI|nr:hypothetical protein SADUNF_Sadunf17G0072400 [Salix dunnii]
MKMKMALNPDSVKVKNSNEKSKSKKNKKNQGNDKDEEDMGCWFKLRLLGSCMPSRSKVDSSLSGISTHYAQSKSTNDKNKDQPVVPAMSSTTTTSNAESASSFPTFSEELKLASQLRKFTFNDLKLATRNFRPESLLGEGGFGCVFKGWIEENGTAPVKPGTGLTVAVKTLNHDGLQEKRKISDVHISNHTLEVYVESVKFLDVCQSTSRYIDALFGKSWFEFRKKLESLILNCSSLNQHNLFPHMLALFKISSTIDVYFSLSMIVVVLTLSATTQSRYSSMASTMLKSAKIVVVLSFSQWFKQPSSILQSSGLKSLSRKVEFEMVFGLSFQLSLNSCIAVFHDNITSDTLDMASSSYYFQTMQADRNKSNMNAKNGIRTQAGFITRNGQPLRSLSDFEIALSKMMERASSLMWWPVIGNHRNALSRKLYIGHWKDTESQVLRKVEIQMYPEEGRARQLACAACTHNVHFDSPFEPVSWSLLRAGRQGNI